MAEPERIPTHRCEMYLSGPGGGWVVISETKPTKKLKVHGYCKYCYTVHRNWWQMRFEDYGEDAVLCGRCEHVSLKESIHEFPAG